MADDQQIVQRIAMKALIVNDQGRILILREASTDTYEESTNSRRYHMPGGRLNPGEAFLDGLRREVAEETGLEVEVGKPLYVGEWHPLIKGVPHQIVAVFFVCKSLTNDVRLSEEHDAYEWILPEEVTKYDMAPPEDIVIETYRKSLK
jgi:8-oxo-dGTP diphosphatase